jgi:DNA-binding CsgD family transcriptional regulator
MQAGGSSLGKGFYEFTYWFRIATLSIVVLFTLFGISEINPVITVLMLLYNVGLRLFRKRVHLILSKFPAAIGFDVLVSFLSIALTGGYRSPFQLYTLSPVISGAYFFGFGGGILLAAMQCILYYIAFSANGHTVAAIMRNGEQLISTYLEYFIVGLCIAYISELLKMFDETSTKKDKLEKDLDETLTFLQASPDFAGLSRRELQVLCLIVDGKTVEQIAGALSISKDSAKTYLSRMYKKIGVSSKYEAICKALESGLASD